RLGRPPRPPSHRARRRGARHAGARRAPSVPRRRGAHRPAHAPPTRPMRTATPLFVGVDAGGTKTALRAEAGEALSARTGPGVNVRRAGPERAVEVLAGL